MTDSKIIVALDGFKNQFDVLNFCHEYLDPLKCRVKVGKDLFVKSGPLLVTMLKSTYGFDVFLDLKFFDIPNTVAEAVRATADLGVWMVSLHALGGPKMMKAAVNSLEQISNPPKLAAVTILTSFEEEDLDEIGIAKNIQNQVDLLTFHILSSGIDVIICSPHEVKYTKREYNDFKFKIVTPGIRPLGTQPNDQARYIDPKTAILNGSDYLVIGRPIIQAKDPKKAFEDIINSIL